MRRTEIKVIKESKLSTFESRVNNLLKNNWKLIGSMIVLPSNRGGCLYYQQLSGEFGTNGNGKRDTRTIELETIRM